MHDPPASRDHIRRDILIHSGSVSLFSLPVDDPIPGLKSAVLRFSANHLVLSVAISTTSTPSAATRVSNALGALLVFDLLLQG